jgi:acetyltransferase
MRFISGLSQESLYQRLQYSAREVSSASAARLLELDYVDTLAIAAIAGPDDGGDIVGVSRYARIDGTDRAECAVVVADAWQGRGIGTELMRSLAGAARARGILALVGLSLAENKRIGDWARQFGFRAITEPNSGGMLQVTLDLNGLPS